MSRTAEALRLDGLQAARLLVLLVLLCLLVLTRIMNGKQEAYQEQTQISEEGSDSTDAKEEEKEDGSTTEPAQINEKPSSDDGDFSDTGDPQDDTTGSSSDNDSSDDSNDSSSDSDDGIEVNDDGDIQLPEVP